MTKATRQSIAVGLVWAIGFASGIGVIHARDKHWAPRITTPAPLFSQVFRPAPVPVPEADRTITKVLPPQPEVSYLLRMTRPGKALPARAAAPRHDALERAYRQHLAREGLTPRVSHEAH